MSMFGLLSLIRSSCFLLLLHCVVGVSVSTGRTGINLPRAEDYDDLHIKQQVRPVSARLLDRRSPANSIVSSAVSASGSSGSPSHDRNLQRQSQYTSIANPLRVPDGHRHLEVMSSSEFEQINDQWSTAKNRDEHASRGMRTRHGDSALGDVVLSESDASGGPMIVLSSAVLSVSSEDGVGAGGAKISPADSLPPFTFSMSPNALQLSDEREMKRKRERERERLIEEFEKWWNENVRANHTYILRNNTIENNGTVVAYRVLSHETVFGLGLCCVTLLVIVFFVAVLLSST